MMTEHHKELTKIIQTVLPRIFGKKDSPDSLAYPQYPGVEDQKELAFSREIDRLGTAIEKMYDPLTAKGLLIRIGRESFILIRRKFTLISCLGEIENRLKPIHRRFVDSFQLLADWVAKEMDVDIHMDCEAEFEFRFELKNKDRSHVYFSYFLIGMLEEFCYWLDTRKNYNLAFIDGNSQASSEIAVLIKDLE